MSDFTNTCWVVDLGNVTSGGGSTSAQSINVTISRRSTEPRSWCLMQANVQQKTLSLR